MNLSDIFIFVIGANAEADAELIRDLFAFIFINGRQVNDRSFDPGDIFLCPFYKINDRGIRLPAIDRTADPVINLGGLSVQRNGDAIDQPFQLRQDVPSPEQVRVSVGVDPNDRFLLF